MPLFAVADFFLQGGEKIERYVGRLKIAGIGMGDVMRQRAEGGGARRGFDFISGNQRGRVNTRKQASGNGFHIALDAANLPGKKDSRVRLHLQSLSQ